MHVLCITYKTVVVVYYITQKLFTSVMWRIWRLVWIKRETQFSLLLFSRTSDQSFIFHCLVCCAFTVVIAERVLCYWLVTVCAALVLFGNNYKIWEELMKWPVNLFSLHSYTFKVRQKYLLKCPQTHTYIDNIMHRHNQLIIYL